MNETSGLNCSRSTMAQTYPHPILVSYDRVIYDIDTLVDTNYKDIKIKQGHYEN